MCVLSLPVVLGHSAHIPAGGVHTEPVQAAVSIGGAFGHFSTISTGSIFGSRLGYTVSFLID
jgi:hypothetical protein